MKKLHIDINELSKYHIIRQIQDETIDGLNNHIKGIFISRQQSIRRNYITMELRNRLK